MPQGFVQNAVATRDYLSCLAEDRLAATKGYAFTGDDRFVVDYLAEETLRGVPVQASA